MEQTVINYVKEVLKTESVRIVERLLGGMSNYTYVVEANKELYTFRIPGEFAEHFVDRNIEKANIAIVEKLGITNRTLYLNTENGYKLAKYVPGSPLSTLSSYPYESVAALLKKIHNSSLSAVNDYQPFDRLHTYEGYIKELGYVHPESYKALCNEFLGYRPFLEAQKKTLTHGDSQPSNFVLHEEKLMVVDFEFCANNDPLYDIACFANRKYEEGLKLLYVYFDEVGQNELMRFHLWRCFQCLQWFNVAIFKELKGLSKTLHIDFQKVAEHYLELAAMLLEKIAKIQ